MFEKDVLGEMKEWNTWEAKVIEKSKKTGMRQDRAARIKAELSKGGAEGARPEGDGADVAPGESGNKAAEHVCPNPDVRMNGTLISVLPATGGRSTRDWF